jgi:CBS domain-containing protein
MLPWLTERLTASAKQGQQSLRITATDLNEPKLNPLCTDEACHVILKDLLKESGVRVNVQRDTADTSKYCLDFSWGEADPVESQSSTFTKKGKKPRPKPVAYELRTNLAGGGVETLKTVFEQLPVQQFAAQNWDRKRLILVGNAQPLERALSRFNTHRISCLPVVDDNSKLVVGMIDVFDVMRMVCSIFENETHPERRRQDFLGVPITNVMSGSTVKRYIISPETSLMDAIRFFNQYNTDHFTIVDRPMPAGAEEQTKSESQAIGVLSQFDFIRFLARNVGWMKREKFFNRSLSSLGLGTAPPVIMNQDNIAFNAFIEMHKKNVGGVALVDNDGTLIGNLSASDIKGMTRQNFGAIVRPVQEFLMRDKKRGWWSLPITVQATDTLEQAILQFAAAKVHRMYLVDSAGKPTGEITIMDIIRQLNKLT